MFDDNIYGYVSVIRFVNVIWWPVSIKRFKDKIQG
jgi:hypothetical protein